PARGPRQQERHVAGWPPNRFPGEAFGRRRDPGRAGRPDLPLLRAVRIDADGPRIEAPAAFGHRSRESATPSQATEPFDAANVSGLWLPFRRELYAHLRRDSTRTVRGPVPPRGGRDGRGLPGPRHAPRP